MSDQLKFSSSARVADLSGRPRRWPMWQAAQGGSLLKSLDWPVVGTLTLLLLLGFGLRLTSLSAIGFAEDEMNKLDAIRAYEQGDLTANGEHPMVMKTLMYVTLKGARALGNGTERISEETALRLPNVLFGALTVIPLFLLTAAFFDRWTGLLAAAFWAGGINAITYNRVGKEDTLMVFFMLFAFYFYLRAKQASPREVPLRRRNYILSGCSFGLMLASKYFPHYWGLNALYHHNFRVRTPVAGEPTGKTSSIFYFVLVFAFLIANPAILIPQVWQYLNAYMGERLLVHSGYLFAGELYKNTMSGSPFWGTPIYFYLLFMAIKIPLSVLAAFLIGLVVAIQRWREPGHAFLLLMLFFWIVPYSLAGGKWLRYTLSLMPFVYMLAAVGVVALVRLLMKRFEIVRRAPALVSAVIVLVFIAWPALIAYANAPHYALYTNALGGGRSGYFFPHDEFYDDGLREAIRFVSSAAPKGAVLAHETPAVTRYYLEKFQRTDLNARAISSPDFDPAKITGVAYVIVQRGRIYFENREKLDYIRVHFRKVHEVMVHGVSAAEVFVNN